MIATEQAAQGGGKDIAKMGKRVAKARPHTLVEEDLVGVKEAVKELDYKVDALDTKIDNVETALTTKIDNVETALTTKIDNVETALTTKIDNVETALTTKIDTMAAALTTKIDTVAAALTTKIDTVAAVLNIKLEGVGKGIGEMKSWIKWGVIVGVGFMTALLVIIGIVVSKLG